MNRRRSLWRSGTFGLALLALAATTGCGKKGPPRPPPRLIPAQTTDLVVRQIGDHLELELAYPSVTTGGLPLAGIQALEVLAMRPQAAGAAELDPRIFEATAKVAKRLEGPDLVEATRGPRLVVTLDAGPGSALGPMTGERQTPATAPEAGGAPGASAAAASDSAGAAAPPGEAAPAPPTVGPTAASTPTADSPLPLRLAIRTYGPRRNASALSNIVGITPRTPPPPIETLHVEARERGIRLTWTPSSEATEPPFGFDVLRRLLGEVSFGAPVAQVGPDRLEHLDDSAVYGTHYQYAVRTVAARDPLVASADGTIGEIDYEDTFPPPVPERLVALAEEGRIRLLWDRVDAPDLAGYRVYRRENDGDETVVREPGAGPGHNDDQVRPGATYTYRVTAVDLRGNESAKSEPATAIPR